MLGTEWKIQCCFCGEFFLTKQLQSHMKSCVKDYQKNIDEIIIIPPEYEHFFLELFKWKQDFLSEKLVDEFNVIANKYFIDYSAKLEEKKEMCGKYRQRLQLIPVIIDFQKIDIITGLKKIGEIFSEYPWVYNLVKEDPKMIFCYLCARNINFWDYHLHLLSCASSFTQDCKTYSLPISSSDQIEKPNFNILIEIVKELANGKYRDKEYVNFLCNELHVECEAIHLKYLPSMKFSHTKNREFIIQNMDHDSAEAIFEKNIQQLIPCENKQPEVFVLNGMKCFICGDYFMSSGFEIHYVACKSNYIQSGKTFERPIIEPETFRDLLDKIVLGLETKEEREEYNSLSEKMHWHITSKTCSKCKKEFQPEVYVKHVKICMREKKKALSKTALKCLQAGLMDINLKAKKGD